MVDVITPTKEEISINGRTPAIHLSFTGFDAATEYGVFDAWGENLGWIPTSAIAIITRTGGAQAVLDIDVDVSMDGTNYVASDINNMTTKDTYAYHPAAGAMDDSGKMAWRHWKVYIVDEGEGNTLTVDLWLF